MSLSEIFLSFGCLQKGAHASFLSACQYFSGCSIFVLILGALFVVSDSDVLIVGLISVSIVQIGLLDQLIFKNFPKRIGISKFASLMILNCCLLQPENVVSYELDSLLDLRMMNGMYTYRRGVKLAKFPALPCTNDDSRFKDFKGCVPYMSKFGHIIQVKEEDFNKMQNNQTIDRIEVIHIDTIRFFNISLLYKPYRSSLREAIYIVLGKTFYYPSEDAMRSFQNSQGVNYTQRANKIALSLASINKHFGSPNWRLGYEPNAADPVFYEFNGLELKEGDLPVVKELRQQNSKLAKEKAILETTETDKPEWAKRVTIIAFSVVLVLMLAALSTLSVLLWRTTRQLNNALSRNMTENDYHPHINNDNYGQQPRYEGGD